jgi:chromosome partitioning protein
LSSYGVRALALISEEEETLGRSIRHAVVFTMTRAIKSRQHTAIEMSLKRQDVDVIIPPLMERAAFSALFEFGGDLRTMPVQGKMQPAIENASLFASAVYDRLVEKRA